MDQLERLEESKGEGVTNVGNNKAFGEIPSVPWLDKMAKEYCQKTLDEAREKAEVRVQSMICICFLGTSRS